MTTDPGLPARILFVCTANRIRSAFAAAAAVQSCLAPPWAAGVPILSRGTEAVPGLPVTREAHEVALTFGIDLSAHRSAALRPEDLQGAWLIGMSERHLGNQEGVWRANLLGDFAGIGPIADPIGQPKLAYRGVFTAIMHALESWSRQKK